MTLERTPLRFAPDGAQALHCFAKQPGKGFSDALFPGLPLPHARFSAIIHAERPVTVGRARLSARPLIRQLIQVPEARLIARLIVPVSEGSRLQRACYSCFCH
jgi:hypothetical protein